MRIYEKQITPKYIRIYEWVHARIRDGRMKPGEKIPTEPELAEKFDASRMTVRKAIDPLVLEGVVQRKPGKGTFVVSPVMMTLTYDAGKPIRFSHDMAGRDIPHHWELVDRELVKADHRIQKCLNLKCAEQVICLTIILYANNEPVIVERNYFPYETFKALYEMKIDVPPLQLVADKFGRHIKHVTQYISAVVAGKREMELFKTDDPIPCIYLEWISHGENETPFSVSLCHYRSDVFKFKIPTSELVKADWL